MALRVEQPHGIGGPVVDSATCIIDRIRREQRQRRHSHRCRLRAIILRLHEAARTPRRRDFRADRAPTRSHALDATDLSLLGGRGGMAQYQVTTTPTLQTPSLFNTRWVMAQVFCRGID